MKRLLFFLFTCSIGYSFQTRAQCTMTAKCTGGDWSVASTWVPVGCGSATVPTDNTLVIIPACATVDVDINSPVYNNMQIDVYGTLNFEVGQKINMCPGTVNVYAGGQLTGGNSGSKINICGTTVWNGGTTTSGPLTFGGGTTLPIELVKFEVYPDRHCVNLKWTTASESNNEYFTVERSKDAVNFEIVSIEAGAINSNTIREYHSIDRSPYEGLSYYRLKQTDTEGGNSYSDMLEVDRRTSLSQMDIFPNPNDGVEFRISVSGQEGEEVLVVVMDALGREAYSKVQVLSQADNIFVIDPSGKLESGIYIVTAASRDVLLNKKMIVN